MAAVAAPDPAPEGDGTPEGTADGAATTHTDGTADGTADGAATAHTDGTPDDGPTPVPGPATAPDPAVDPDMLPLDVEEWLSWLATEKGRARATLAAYRRDARRWCTWLADRGVAL